MVQKIENHKTSVVGFSIVLKKRNSVYALPAKIADIKPIRAGIEIKLKLGFITNSAPHKVKIRTKS